MNCNCSDEITMLPVQGIGFAVSTKSIPKTDLTPLEERVKELEKKLEEALDLAKNNAAYQLCEFYSFRNPQKKKGFELAHGELLENASALYPEAWAFLQTDEGKALCVTEDEWQALTHAVYYTATSKDEADKDVIQEFSFDGIGGAPFYVQDIDAGTLRLPDIRGMYAEASGFDGLTVGGVHGDMMRNIAGEIGYVSHGCLTVVNGGFKGLLSTTGIASVTGKGNSPWYKRAILDTSRVVPTGNTNKPRAFGVLPCVYLGNNK